MNFATVLTALLPRGPLWEQLARAPLFSALVDALAAELDRVQERSARIIDEADPRTTLELFEEWESAHGLPSTCMEVGATLTARRDALVERVVEPQPTTPAFFQQVAEGLGYAVWIEEHKARRHGMDYGGTYYDAAWASTCTVRVLATYSVSDLEGAAAAAVIGAEALPTAVY